MRYWFFCLLLLSSLTSFGQVDLKKPFQDCRLNGSITVYDSRHRQWIVSDEADSQNETLPASTFKIINTLIALETGVIRDENEVVKWVGKVDTVLYGYRPEIYHDMTMKEAFEQSAGWVYIELAKRIGKDRYRQYLQRCHYGNGTLSHPDDDFWNFGAFGISPRNQVTFLKDVYDEKLPFSKRSYAILKRIMVAEKTDTYTIRAKTGWTRYGGNDTGWWVGYVERDDNVYFFATRLIKPRSTPNPDFGACRKTITKAVLRQLKAIE
ncbi:class D beta-lactamase [Fibrisoma montanum]|uniref:beta-lactamase n=1 Tax=Fibrisoma montanum TaxID=2305895 RepID=A0A418LX52_9BACT|nr:penicillin-binding transpeptidase domain-containing protein [Fibrisoma montanum]RIV17833.1 class D beta-lactamase [Fibrisoma montanum]